jgi:hypothetical protein
MKKTATAGDFCKWVCPKMGYISDYLSISPFFGPFEGENMMVCSGFWVKPNISKAK